MVIPSADASGTAWEISPHIGDKSPTAALCQQSTLVEMDLAGHRSVRGQSAKAQKSRAARKQMHETRSQPDKRADIPSADAILEVCRRGRRTRARRLRSPCAAHLGVLPPTAAGVRPSPPQLTVAALCDRSHTDLKRVSQRGVSFIGDEAVTFFGRTSRPRPPILQLPTGISNERTGTGSLRRSPACRRLAIVGRGRMGSALGTALHRRFRGHRAARPR